MAELVLGTAQLGLYYGINNKRGKPSVEETFKILDTAYENGIRMLDTAAAYGDSEELIGRYMKSTGRSFRICTKLPKLDTLSLTDSDIEDIFNKSLRRLGVDHIDYFLLHDFSDLINGEIMDQLCAIKLSGRIFNIGVSIYEPEQLEIIIKQYNDIVNAVQLPFNILDQRWNLDNLFYKAKSKDIEIFARSIYLQGLFFADREKADKIHPNAWKYLENLREISREVNSSVEQVSLAYVSKQPEISYLVIGAEEPAQIERNAKLVNETQEMLNPYNLKQIRACFMNVEKEIIDPRYWNK